MMSPPRVYRTVKRPAVVTQLFASALLTLMLCEFSFAQETSNPPAATEIAVEPPEQQRLILVVGAPGTDEYQTNFQTWAERWKSAAERASMKSTSIGVSSAEATRADAETDAIELTSAVSEAAAIASSEPLWIVFIGHGTFDGRTASWNLHGPDLTAQDLAAACENAKRPLAIIVCASCSAPFINALSGPQRIVVTATKDGNQIQYCRFGDALSQAISGLDADINRDSQTSLLEAWLFASRRTAEFYKTEGRLATEHSLLDDNGDAKGVRSELYSGDRIADNVENPDVIDGRLAARWHFVRSDEENRLTPQQRETRDSLELQLEQLRKTKSSMPEDEYLRQLESILVPLAQLYAQPKQTVP